MNPDPTSREAPLPVLYVDDEPHNLEIFRIQFGETHDVRTASSGDEALAILAREPIGVLLTDERMPGMRGIDLLSRAHDQWPDTVRIIVSAYNDAQRLLLAINRGHAHEYMLKPWSQAELASCLSRGLAVAQRRRELVAKADMAELLSRDARATYDPSAVVGELGGLRAAMDAARRAAASDATVLLLGETGTGKELFARLIHEASPRAGGPLVRVNCAALSEGVLASELFGHEQGAFTGAHKTRRGRFELADRGTIFLDEIGDISPEVQVSLLRVLQEKELERVGGASTIRVDTRVVAATHQDLQRLVAEGRFREDLYYRLNVLLITIPPLRERPQDIAPLLEHFIAKYSARSARPTLREDAIERLAAYSWPGNVRELENLVQRALILAQGSEIGIEDFSLTFSVPLASSIRDGARRLEAEQLRQLLLAHGGNCARAARAMGVPRTTFISRAKKYGLCF
jgi:DNA-binding NtrC family response regulator